MRYELMRFAQLVFALSVMFAAFAAGLTVGWLRWGRRGADDPLDLTAGAAVTPPAPVPRIVKPDLFRPDVLGDPGGDVTTTRPIEFRPGSLGVHADVPPAPPQVVRAGGG